MKHEDGRLFVTTLVCTVMLLAFGALVILLS